MVEHSTENAGVVGSIPSLGTNGEIDKALSQMRSGLRHFYFDRILFNTAKLTAIVDGIPHFPRDLVQA